MKITFSIRGTTMLNAVSVVTCYILAVRSVTLPPMRGLEHGDLLHFSLERGSKTVNSPEKQMGDKKSPVGDTITEINEDLSLSVTLYRDSHGDIQVTFPSANFSISNSIFLSYSTQSSSSAGEDGDTQCKISKAWDSRNKARERCFQDHWCCAATFSRVDGVH